MHVSHIYTYPLKSAAGVSLPSSLLTPKGLEYDRHWALIDADHEVITGREFPELLALKPELTADGLIINHDDGAALTIPYPPQNQDVVHVTVFDNPATAVLMPDQVHTWFSDYLKTSCRMVYMDAHCRRDVLPENGGREGDIVAYADECPLLLLSEASVEDLNTRLDEPVTLRKMPGKAYRSAAAYLM